jgi:hypothetical protein
MTPHPTTPPTPAAGTACIVEYLDPRDGWQPTNLGRFAGPDEARAAAAPWRDGYARTNAGHRPPTRIAVTA